MLIQWNPWRDLSRLEKDMLSFFDNGRVRQRAENGDAQKPPTWAPPVDVYEDEAKYVIVADVPGVEEKDLDIRVENNLLSIKGERKVEHGDGHTRTERVRGGFARSFTLPPTVDTEKVAAELKAGVLTLTLPKKAELQPRQIKVSTQS